MYIETNETVMLSPGEDLAGSLIGGVWTEFKSYIPEPQSKVLTDGFNLILLSLPDSLLQNVITELLIGDKFDLKIKKMQIFELITNNIIDVLTRLGFTLNMDEATHVHLEEMIQIGNFFYEMDEYEDLIGLSDTLGSTDIPPVTRFLMIFQKYLGENANLEEHHLLLDDVSEVTLKAIQDNLTQSDLEDGVPKSLEQRIRDNVDVIRGTLAYQHVSHNGRIGGPVVGMLNFFSVELKALLNFPTPDNLAQYGKEVTAIYLISELNTPSVKDSLLQFLNTVITDHLALNAIEVFVDRLVLPHD